jgi:hypothetical protein
MPGCAHCGVPVPIVGNQVGRRDTCPDCGAELHSCRNCRHFEPHVAKQCKEPFAEVPADKDGANFCEFFQISEGGKNPDGDKADLLSAAESLFRKK